MSRPRHRPPRRRPGCNRWLPVVFSGDMVVSGRTMMSVTMALCGGRASRISPLMLTQQIPVSYGNSRIKSANVNNSGSPSKPCISLFPSNPCISRRLDVYSVFPRIAPALRIATSAQSAFRIAVQMREPTEVCCRRTPTDESVTDRRSIILRTVRSSLLILPWMVLTVARRSGHVPL